MKNKSMNKILALGVVAAMTAGMLAGCGSSASTTDGAAAGTEAASNSAASNGEVPTLVWWTIGGTPADDFDQAVSQISDYAEEKIGVRIDVKIAGWADYETKMNNIINTGEYFDLMFVNNTNYTKFVNLNALENITDLVQSETPDLYNFIPADLWEGAKIHGNVYAVPTYKDSSLTQFWMLDDTYVQKYGIDVDSIKDYASLNDALQTIKEGEEGLVSTIGDEGLYGQACQVRTAPGGVTAAGVQLPPDVAEVVSFYGYHGYVNQRELQFVREEELWEYLGADLVLVGRATDVLSLPKVQGVRMMELERGGVLRRQPETAEEAEAHKGWAKVLLTDGRTGYVRDVALEPVKYEMTAVFSQREGLAFNDALAETLNTTADKLVPEAVARWYGGSEDAFRAAVCEQAKKYMGTEYRWGGKSGRGIDCSGLVSSAYMQCGVLIYRDAKIIEGWPMHEVAFENKKPGDALFFPGHVALYLGEGRYIHSTGAAVSGGVVINSLEPSDPLYREDLVKCLYAVGSIF